MPDATTSNAAFRRTYGDPAGEARLADNLRAGAERILDPARADLNKALAATTVWSGPAADAFRAAATDDLNRLATLVTRFSARAAMLRVRADEAEEALLACRYAARSVGDRYRRVCAALDVFGPQLATATVRPTGWNRLPAAAALLGPAAKAVGTPDGRAAALAYLFGPLPDLADADDPAWADYRLPAGVDQFLGLVGALTATSFAPSRPVSATPAAAGLFPAGAPAPAPAPEPVPIGPPSTWHQLPTRSGRPAAWGTVRRPPRMPR